MQLETYPEQFYDRQIQVHKQYILQQYELYNFTLTILRTVLEMSDYRVASCISIGYLIPYVIIIVKTIIDNDTKVFFCLD